MYFVIVKVLTRIITKIEEPTFIASEISNFIVLYSFRVLMYRGYKWISFKGSSGYLIDYSI